MFTVDRLLLCYFFRIQSIMHVPECMQILMNVRLSLLVIQVLCAPTHLDPSHVHATQDTVEMECRAMVGA